jgi:hypothetical protein
MFVGDSVETDIVGGNRIGMRIDLLSAREFTFGDDSNDDPETQPDHHINRLLDVVDIVVPRIRTIPRRNGTGRPMGRGEPMTGPRNERESDGENLNDCRQPQTRPSRVPTLDTADSRTAK